MVVTASYVGSRAYDLSAAPTDFTTAINENLNQLNPQYLSMGSALLQTVANPFFGIIQTGSLAGPTTTQTQLLRPYPQYTGVTRMAPGFGNSHYHSAQIPTGKTHFPRADGAGRVHDRKNLTDLNNADNAYDRQDGAGLLVVRCPAALLRVGGVGTAVRPRAALRRPDAAQPGPAGGRMDAFDLPGVSGRIPALVRSGQRAPPAPAAAVRTRTAIRRKESTAPSSTG